MRIEERVAMSRVYKPNKTSLARQVTDNIVPDVQSANSGELMLLETPEVRVTRPKQKKRGGYLIYAQYLLVPCVFFFLALVVASNMRLTALTAEAGSMRGQLEKLNKENDALHARAESRISMSEVQKKAELELGMQKLKRKQIEYVDLSLPDEVVVIEDENSTDFISSVQKSLEYYLEAANK